MKDTSQSIGHAAGAQGTAAPDLRTGSTTRPPKPVLHAYALALTIWGGSALCMLIDRLILGNPKPVDSLLIWTALLIAQPAVLRVLTGTWLAPRFLITVVCLSPIIYFANILLGNLKYFDLLFTEPLDEAIAYRAAVKSLQLSLLLSPLVITILRVIKPHNKKRK